MKLCHDELLIITHHKGFKCFELTIDPEAATNTIKVEFKFVESIGFSIELNNNRKLESRIYNLFKRNDLNRNDLFFRMQKSLQKPISKLF